MEDPGQALVVDDDGHTLAFAFADLLRYAGPGSPGGVAHAFQVMARSFPLVADGPPPRRSLQVQTAFGGPGARDAFELVTRAVTGGRYVVDPALARPQDGVARERFVFRVRCGERSVTLALRPGFVSEEFIALTRAASRTPAEEEHLTALKARMADAVMARPPAQVYDVV